MSSSFSLSDNFFQLFGLVVDFVIDKEQLAGRYRKLQAELHPDRYASASNFEKRLAVQHSAHVNEAYDVLKRPLSRALYLMELAGLSQEDISRHQVDGGFLITQMELREKLESVPGLVDPDEVLDHLVKEINDDLRLEQDIFARAHRASDIDAASGACVKMQYLEKLLQEAEQVEADLMEK
jgi:molecular chaperone HscB